MSSEQMLPLAAQNNNIIRLAVAQALAGANSVVFYATGAIVGNTIAPSPSLATLPITLFVLGMAASILPLGALARKRGRKAAFMAGTGAGVVTGLAAALAVVLGSFLLFCFAAMLGGAYAAVALSFRFAATDGVAPERRARALSLVMGGGVAAGIIGPMLVTGTMHLWPTHTFAFTFLAQALVAALAAILLAGVTPAEPAAASVRGGRPLREIVRQPGFATTVFSGVGVYHYWLSLILLGIGWNFGFTGASAKIINFHRPEEKTQVQSLNDFLVFGVMIVGSFSSGVLLNAFGWNAVLWGSLAPVGLALFTLLLRPLSPPRA